MAAPSIAPAKPSEAGLADVIACNSSICLVDGDNCRLLYRGYDIVDLAEHSTFEEVAYTCSGTAVCPDLLNSKPFSTVSPAA